MQPASPSPLAPSGLSGEACARLEDLGRRHLVGAGNRVVHQRAGEQLAVRVVRRSPPARSGPRPWARQPWSWPSARSGLMIVPASSSQTRRSGIDHGRSPRSTRSAHDEGAELHTSPRRLEERRGLEPRRLAGRQRWPPAIGRGGDLAPRHRAVGGARPPGIRRGRRRRPRPRPPAAGRRCAGPCRARRARPARARCRRAPCCGCRRCRSPRARSACRRARTVDIVGRDAQVIGHDLRERRLVPLAVRRSSR